MTVQPPRAVRVAGALHDLVGRGQVVVTRLRVNGPRVRRPVRIAFASDLHAGSPGWRGTMLSLLRVLRKLRPDHLVLGGDLVDRHVSYLPALLRPLSRACSGRLMAVRGNHDTKRVRSIGPWRTQLERLEAWDLSNRLVTLVPGLQVGGIDCGLNGDPDPEALRSAMEPEALRIGIVHNPEEVERLPAGLFDFVLSGHTHGGQFRLPFIGALGWPKHYTLRDFEGWSRIGAHDTYISRGIGTVHIPVRLLCPAEVVLVEVS